LSDENVEVALAAVNALNARDWDAWLRLQARDVEVFPDARFPESQPLRGRDAYRRWVEDNLSPWSESRVEPVETVPAGKDRVLMRWTWHAEGATSGISTSVAVTSVYTFQNGVATKVEFYLDHDEALDALSRAE
jgi:ketosteroid isomerase-like protein